jgi:hypothetical protein
MFSEALAMSIENIIVFTCIFLLVRGVCFDFPMEISMYMDILTIAMTTFLVWEHPTMTKETFTISVKMFYNVYENLSMEYHILSRETIRKKTLQYPHTSLLCIGRYMP